MTEHERDAIGLYAVLARDTADFYEMVREANPGTAEVLAAIDAALALVRAARGG